MMGKVLIVEDSDDLQFTLLNIVRKEGYDAVATSTGAGALEILTDRIVDLVFLDIGLPDWDGIQLISSIMNLSPDVDVVMLTGMNDAKSAVHSLRAGAVDYILKPFDLLEFRHVLGRIMRGRLAVKKARLEGKPAGVDNIIGRSNAILSLKEEIIIASGVNSPVLITGETGTGKELVARAVHSAAERESGVFVKVDCGTLASNIIESDLFGHEKGSFTDARRDKKGLVEMAAGGTLFLDEIGNLPLELQPKLLRLIEESVFRRVGGLRDIHVNLRIIAATNINIEDEVRNGRFREDLFYRLNVLRLDVPAMRDRGKDILLIADYFLRRFSNELNRKIKGLSPDAEKLILDHDWQGNIRELKNSIERAVIYCRGDWLTPENLPQTGACSTLSVSGETFVSLEEMGRRYVLEVLEACRNNKTRAAKILGISRTTLRDKLL